MSYFNNLTETIGNTPMVILNNIYQKSSLSEYGPNMKLLIPGNSVKDRIGLKMIIDAEKKGYLKAWSNNY